MKFTRRIVPTFETSSGAFIKFDRSDYNSFLQI